MDEEQPELGSEEGGMKGVESSKRGGQQTGELMSNDGQGQ
eukprot:CAMPEP_0202965414 /NCGR_PEP_ID=MMETSP1396-20130829/9395_1 /ASSEMBLY_ACC=CAM_ASM_000872 /TAXON_ID= /ORGANISM="Pseudokeronopsis sp., Strain Brazil" /LENGTH=39 /DNA_ID= /DNA_START= /DNA_END= /DNA_ORIENTATION=